MNATFSETPTMFGSAHIVALLLVAAANIAAGLLMRKLDEKRLLNTLHILGFVMLLAEVFKQWFCFTYVFHGEPNLWFFPWQLCSMAMYCSFLVKFLKGKTQMALLVFLATYSPLGGLVALILPYDMLRPQIALFIHSFAYHGLILTEAMIAVMILSKRSRTIKPAFLPATLLFLIMAAIAFIINTVSHAVLADPNLEPNMFYITPAYPSTQPILHDIAVKYGIPVEIVLYLALIILTSYVIFLIEKLVIRIKQHA